MTVLEFASLRLRVDRTSVQKVRPVRVKFCSDIKRRNSFYITEEVRKMVCASGVLHVHNKPRPLRGCGNPHVSITVFSRRIKILYGRIADEPADMITCPCSRIYPAIEFP